MESVSDNREDLKLVLVGIESRLCFGRMRDLLFRWCKHDDAGEVSRTKKQIQINEKLKIKNEHSLMNGDLEILSLNVIWFLDLGSWFFGNSPMWHNFSVAIRNNRI
jgi:hypothetical protein